MDIIILRLYNCTICAHIIIIQKGIQTGTQTHGHTDKKLDKHMVDSHTQTDICFERFTVLTDCMPHV